MIICAAAALSASALSSLRAGAQPAELELATDVVTLTAKPRAEVVAETTESVSIRFQADERSSLGTASVFVRVPDTGRIVPELGSHELGAGNLVVISEPAIMRDLRLVRVDFTPTPSGVEGGSFARSLDVTLRATAEPGINEKERSNRPFSPAFHALYEGTVINYDGDAAEQAYLDGLGRSRDPLPFGARYLVISANGFTDEVYPLVKWTNAKGIRSKMVDLSTTGGSAEEIRAYIENAYNTWEIPPEYVLLVGDTEVLPGYDSLTYTDNYFATLEGTDYLADVIIGRLSADTSWQLMTEVAKIFGYERTPLMNDPNWPMSALMMVHDDFDAGDWIYYMNTWRIYDQMEAFGFSPIDTLFKRNDVSMSEVYASVNEGKGFLNFRGQAWINWLGAFAINASNTTNGWRLPIVVSATCGTGNYEFDGFICEDWVRTGSPSTPRGAVAFFATNTAFPGSQELSLRRGYVDEGFFDGVFDDSLRTLGEACLAGKMRLYLKADDRIDYEGWNLLGDPAMTMWTGHPYEFEVLHDAGTQVGPSDFVVTVVSGGTLHEGALVALTMGNDVHTLGYTDALGQVSLPINPTAVGTLSVVVTDRNAAPYEGEALVLDSGPFVIYSDVEVDDASSGNGDGYLNTGETSNVSVALSNIGDEGAMSVTARFRSDDPNITVVDSIAAYGNMDPDATSWGADDFEIEISPGCENGTLISYSVAVLIDGSESVVLNPTPLHVVTAHLEHTATLCDDSAPGGNGDGEPGAGETVGLVVSLTNEGLSGVTDVTGILTCMDPRIVITSSNAPFGDAAAGAVVENGTASFVLSISPTATSGHIVPLQLFLSADGFSYTYSETVEFEIVLTGASVAAPLGPDSYGYYAYDRADSAYGPAPTYDWYDIAPPGPGNLLTAITDEDAGVTTIGMFFPIRFYGNSYDLITINSNGFLAAGSTDYRFGDNSPVPDLHGPPNMIAPFWDDLDPSAGGDIYSWMDIVNHRLIFQFEEVNHWNSPLTETFQVIIYNENYYPTPTNDTPILFQYKDVSLPYGCTVGIENLYQNDGIQWLYDSALSPHAAPVENNAAILFTTVPPSDPDVTWLVLTDSSIDDDNGGNGDGLPQIGETVNLTVEFTSEGGSSADDVSVVLTSSDPAISIVDGTASLPFIPPGGSSQNTSDELTFLVTETVLDTVATLWATVTANGGSYTSSGRVEVPLDMTGTGIEDETRVFMFRPGHPNPFAGSTVMQLSLPSTESVTARVYSPAGRLVKTLVDTRLEAGDHVVPWDGTDATGHRVASGVYFVKLVAGSNRASGKLVLLR